MLACLSFEFSYREEVRDHGVNTVASGARVQSVVDELDHVEIRATRLGLGGTGMGVPVNEGEYLVRPCVAVLEVGDEGSGGEISRQVTLDSFGESDSMVRREMASRGKWWWGGHRNGL